MEKAYGSTLPMGWLVSAPERRFKNKLFLMALSGE
jgi:hypothetical protein